jgi:hypothetical protein
MEKKEKGKTWRGISEEIIVGMTEWREQNPKATFGAIEDELDRRLAELRVRNGRQGKKHRYVRIAGRNWKRGGKRSGNYKPEEGKRSS